MRTPSTESITKSLEDGTPLLASILQRDTIRSLTMSEPWASLVAIGAKRLETRSWAPFDDYRGPLAIHAGLRFDAEYEELCSTEPFYSTLCAHGFFPRRQARRRRNAWQFPLGHVIAVVYLENAYQVPSDEGDLWAEQWQRPAEPEASFGNFAPGRYVWEFSMVYRLSQPIKASGSLGVWNWQPPDSFWLEVQARLDAERQRVS